MTKQPFYDPKTKRSSVMFVQVLVLISLWFITFLAMFLPTYALARFIFSSITGE